MKVARKRKSVVIPPDTLKEIRRAIRSFKTMIDAEETIGVKRQVLDKTLYKNTCSPDTLNQYQSFLNQKAA